MRQPLGVSPRRSYRLRHYRSGRPLLPLVEALVGSRPTSSATLAEVPLAASTSCNGSPRFRPPYSHLSPPAIALWDSEMLDSNLSTSPAIGCACRDNAPTILWELPLGRSEEFLRQSQLQALTAQYWFAPYWNSSIASPYTHYLMDCPGIHCNCGERCMVDRKWRYTHTICNFGGNIHHRRVVCCTEYTLEPDAPRSTLCRTRNRYSADLLFL